jgi:hypothetical protein
MVGIVCAQHVIIIHGRPLTIVVYRSFIVKVEKEIVPISSRWLPSHAQRLFTVVTGMAHSLS